MYIFFAKIKKYADSKAKKLCMCRLHVRSNFYRKKASSFYDRGKKNVSFNKKDIKHMTVTDGCYVTHCVLYNVVISLLIGSNSRD